jgi:hypothetical protein
MEVFDSAIFDLLVAWGIVTALLICLLIYRGTLETHEDDQLFLDSAGDSMAREQRAIVARISKLSRPIAVLFVTSSALLAIVAGMWLWQGYKRF